MQYRAIVLGLALQAAAMALASGGLRGQTATVEVENELDRDLLIWIDGEPRGVVPANDRVAFDGLPDGPVTLLASGLRREGIEASERRVLAPGESFTWVLYPIPVLGEEQGTGILVVTNELDVPAEITAGGLRALSEPVPGARRLVAHQRPAARPALGVHQIHQACSRERAGDRSALLVHDASSARAEASIEEGPGDGCDRTHNKRRVPCRRCQASG